MAKLTGFIVSMLMLGVAHAVEIADAPPPEPNYLGIALFVLIFFGGSAWFLWAIMHKKKRDKE